MADQAPSPSSEYPNPRDIERELLKALAAIRENGRRTYFSLTAPDITYLLALLHNIDQDAASQALASFPEDDAWLS